MGKCSLDVNGKQCNSCRIGFCSSDVYGLSHLDCSNVWGGQKWDFCSESRGLDVPVGDSLFWVFSNDNVFSFEMCPGEVAESMFVMNTAGGRLAGHNHDYAPEHRVGGNIAPQTTPVGFVQGSLFFIVILYTNLTSTFFCYLNSSLLKIMISIKMYLGRWGQR